jgi:hypothetical protein
LYESLLEEKERVIKLLEERAYNSYCKDFILSVFKIKKMIDPKLRPLKFA